MKVLNLTSQDSETNIVAEIILALFSFLRLIPLTLARNKTCERRHELFTQIPANLVFQACISFYRCFETFGPPIRKILVYTGMLPCLAPSWPQIMQIRISFRSRSGFVLDADHALNFLSDLAFQTCISFYSVLDKSGA